jgi:hypothetical protein
VEERYEEAGMSKTDSKAGRKRTMVKCGVFLPEEAFPSFTDPVIEHICTDDGEASCLHVNLQVSKGTPRERRGER